jgi:hemerythrin-like domain-containing protein
MISDTLNNLQTEHQCLLGQAEQIEEQLDLIRGGYDPDYVLLNNRIHFLKGHYIEVHGPKDKALFQELLGGSGNLGAIMAPFLNLHSAAFLNDLDELEADLQAVLCERMVSRGDLLRRGDRALHHLREQIATEEAGPFPWARRSLRGQNSMKAARAKESVPRDRLHADCSKVAMLFPRLARRPAPETTSMEAAWEPYRVLCSFDMDQYGGH